MGYRPHIKIVAYTSGLLTGENQYDTKFNRVLNPNDIMEEHKFTYGVSILWHTIKFNVVDLSQNLRMLPNGSGTLGDLQFDIFQLNTSAGFRNLMRRIFKWNIVRPTTSLIHGTIDALTVNNVLPYDNSAGSYLLLVDGSSYANTVLNLTGAGTRLNFLFNSLTGTSSGLFGNTSIWPIMPNIMNQWNQKASNFTFIPRNSAISWNGALDDDIVHNFTMTQRVNNSPFNAFVGFRDSMGGAFYPNGLANNQDHLDFFNSPPVLPESLIYNNLIGDSVYFLDNLTINRKANWWVNQSIFAGNSENPFFNYQNQTASALFWDEIRNRSTYSDTNNFIVSSNGGDVTFRSADINLNFGFDVEDSARFETILDTVIGRCNFTNADYQNMAPVFLPNSNDLFEQQITFRVVPNPFTNTTTLVNNLPLNSKYQLIIYNGMGSIISNTNEIGSSVNLSSELLKQSGLYHCTVIYNTSIYKLKILKL
jgi:hypothetical protein